MQARDCRRLIFMAIVEETREVLVPEMEGPETFNMIVVQWTFNIWTFNVSNNVECPLGQMEHSQLFAV